MSKLLDLWDTEMGSVVFSAIIGFGIATIFRQTCKGNCVIIKAPDVDDIKQNVYEMDGVCYRYTPRSVPCNS